MSIINVTLAPMVNQQVGLLSYGREAKLTAADLGVPHPDNTVGWALLGPEVIASLCATFQVRSSSANISGLGQTFRTNLFKSTKVEELCESLINQIDFSTTFTPEDDFPEYKPAMVKRALTKLDGLVEKIAQSNGSMVLLYMCYLLGNETFEETLYSLVVPVLENDTENMFHLENVLAGCKAVMLNYKKWDRQNAKDAESYDFVDFTSDTL